MQKIKTYKLTGGGGVVFIQITVRLTTLVYFATGSLYRMSDFISSMARTCSNAGIHSGKIRPCSDFSDADIHLNPIHQE